MVAPGPHASTSDNIEENRLVMRIENISSSATKEHILSLVEGFAVVEKIVMPDPVMWMTIPLGRVEVVFASDNDAANVYARLQGAMVDGAKINLSFVRVEKRVPEKRRRSPTPRRSRDIPRRRSSSERRYSTRRGRQSPPARRDRKSRSRSPASRSSSGSPTWE
jgi:hypothetical protein